MLRFPEFIADEAQPVTAAYDIVIDRISGVFGSYPGTVEVEFHREGGNLGHGARDGFETQRVPLPSESINEDGTHNDDVIYATVRSAIGETEEVAE